MTVVGNVKYDMRVPPGLEQSAAMLREYWGRTRPVWIAASTHEGEEAAVIEAHTRVLKRFPDALLLLAPRHPERFRPAAQLCRQYGFRTLTRSDDTRGHDRDPVLRGRHAGRTADLLRRLRRRLRGRQLRSHRRPQRAGTGGAGHAGADRAAHLQFRRDHRQPDRRARRGDAGRRRRRRSATRWCGCWETRRCARRWARRPGTGWRASAARWPASWRSSSTCVVACERGQRRSAQSALLQAGLQERALRAMAQSTGGISRCRRPRGRPR